MAFRFRRTVSIFPGVRVNLGKRGVSVSAGVRGANVTMGRNGLYGNAGIPGTGLSYREKLSKSGGTTGRGTSWRTCALPGVKLLLKPMSASKPIPATARAMGE